MSDNKKEIYAASFEVSKLGYGTLGFCMGLIGVLLAWLFNEGKPYRSTAVKYT